MAEFVDEAQVNLHGGDGGAGAVSFRREPHVARGGPDGGDGGKGGDVWLVADRNVASLLAFRDHPHRRATSGTHGSGQASARGARGDDLDRAGPRGHRSSATATGEVLADLVHHGDRCWPPGAGGAGGATPASCPTAGGRPASPSRASTARSAGCASSSSCMADVALVGFPNAGQVDADRRHQRRPSPRSPTTPSPRSMPNLGVVRFGEHEFVVADIPGLIEGAARGPGSRPPVPAPRRAGPGAARPARPGRPWTAQPRGAGAGAARRARPLRARAARAAPPGRRHQGRRRRPIEFDGMRISAVTHAGARRRSSAAGRAGRRGPRRRAGDAESFVVHRPEPRRASRVARDDDGVWRVVGRPAERVVAMADLTNAEALAYVQDRLARLGVDRALARAGAREGDTVRIGPFELDYTTAEPRDWPRRRQPPASRRRDDRRRQGRHVVAHRRRRRDRRRAARASSAARSPPPGRAVTTWCSCPRAPSPPGCPRSASTAARPTSAPCRPSPPSASPG